MRTVGFVVVGYFLLSFVAYGLAFSATSPAGMVLAAGGVGGLVWLVRSYRAGKEDDRIRTDAAATVLTVERRLTERASALSALPAEPFDLPWMVELAYAHRDEPELQGRLHAEYQRIRSRAAACGEELERLRDDRRSGPTDARLLLADYEGIDAILDELGASLVELQAGALGSAPDAEAPALADVAPAPAAKVPLIDPLEEAARRAKGARDEVWARALSASASPTFAGLAEQTEDAYRGALTARAALPAPGNPDHERSAAKVLAAFARVEDVARTAETAAAAGREPASGHSRVVGVDRLRAN